MSHRDRLDPPANHRQRIVELGHEVLATLGADLDLARQKANEQYAAIREAEVTAGRSLHKGAALHNIGVVWLGTNDRTALTYFVAAYVEDARTYGSSASRSGAARVLRDLYRHRAVDLARIARAARNHPTIDPLRLATDLLGSDNASALVPTPMPSIDEDSLPPRDRCVFSGGTYRNGGWSSVYVMRKAVGDAGLTPVVVRDFDGKSRRDLEKSIDLLNRCGMAVFDITPTGGNQGWQQELRHLAGSNKPILVLHHDTRVDREWAWPGMLPDPATLNLTTAAYDTSPRERAIVMEWIGKKATIRPTFPWPAPIASSGGSAIVGSAAPWSRPYSVGSNTMDYGPFDVPLAVGSGGDFAPPSEPTPAEVSKYWTERLTENAANPSVIFEDDIDGLTGGPANDGDTSL